MERDIHRRDKSFGPLEHVTKLQPDAARGAKRRRDSVRKADSAQREAPFRRGKWRTL